MGLFVLYAIAIAALIWYTLFYLPFPELTRHFGFALNIVQYGFLSLLSFLVYRQARAFRSVFFQFWIAFAVATLSAPVVYHCMYVWGWKGGVAAFTVVTIVTHGFITWTICKILLHYVFRDEKRWVINVLSAVVVLPLYLWLFWPYWWSPLKLLDLPTGTDVSTLHRPVQDHFIVVNIVSLVLLLAFFWHKFRTDRPIGVYADALLYWFGGWILVETVELIAQIHRPELLNITQWAIAVVATGMLVTLILRLRFKSQSIAQYYESQLLSNDPDIGRRVGFFDRLVLWLFFDPQKVGKRIYLDTEHKKLQVKRTSSRVHRRPNKV
ncbi:hypothetical protein KKH27_04430 [bacterium]|nr:hypothetical protein [bacterium]MBU1983378.1 hypothetical protein [bacterium]